MFEPLEFSPCSLLKPVAIWNLYNRLLYSLSKSSDDTENSRSLDGSSSTKEMYLSILASSLRITSTFPQTNK